MVEKKNFYKAERVVFADDSMRIVGGAIARDYLDIDDEDFKVKIFVFDRKDFYLIEKRVGDIWREMDFRECVDGIAFKISESIRHY